MFRYDTIGKFIEQIAKDTSRPVSNRLNGIYTLKLQPDKRAAITLVALVDDPDEQVTAQAREALHAIGIPVGKDPEARSQIIYELQRKSKEEFLRDWLVRQEERMREERDQTKTWKELFLQTLDRLYGTLQDDPERGRFLAEHLKSQQSERKLWALDRVHQWRVAGKPVPVEIVPALIGLAGDGDKNVRLETAKLLAIMAEVSSPEKLLAQLDAEQEDDVRIKLFVALRMACDYALSSDSGAQISAEVKAKTLGWAERFLSQQDPNKAREGAVVIRRLLEVSGPASKDVDQYLDQLGQRYRQANLADATLRSDLVGVMASLCSSRSACKDQARKQFESIFETARSDENDRVREQAVEGLIGIDKTSTLKKLRQGAIDDRSPKIRKRLVVLAGEVGGGDDLEWLAGRLGPNNPDGEAVWQAMSGIFARCDATILHQWLGKFKTGDLMSRLLPDQWRSFLQLTERKAGGQTDMVRQVLMDLVACNRQKGDLEEEAGYLVKLIAMTKDQQREELTGRLLAVYLSQSKVEQAAQILQAALDKKDLAPQDPMIQAIDDYLSRPADKQDPAKLIDAVVRKVSIKDPRPNWDRSRQRWLGRPGKTAEPSEGG